MEKDLSRSSAHAPQQPLEAAVQAGIYRQLAQEGLLTLQQLHTLLQKP